jgi:hypothetical protein
MEFFVQCLGFVWELSHVKETEKDVVIASDSIACGSRNQGVSLYTKKDMLRRAAVLNAGGGFTKRSFLSWLECHACAGRGIG